MTKEQIAQVCHEANHAYCEVIGESPYSSWKDVPQWQKDSVIDEVQFCIDNPRAQDKDFHDRWVAKKKADGWGYGRTKDASAKTHPCMVAFNHLPVAQRLKDQLFRGICRALLFGF